MKISFLERAEKIFRRIPVWFLFVILGIITYGLLISKMGFYLDDWYIVLFQKYFGAGHFAEFFKGDRPFFGFVYDIFVPIFKDSRIGWQLFALATHILTAIVFWYLLELLAPKHKWFNVIAGLFFLVYPGFKFHWFSVMYSQVFFLYAVYFLSFVLMVRAISANKARVWYVIGAMLCQIIGIVPQESFLGLEFVRPILLYIALQNIDPVSRKRNLQKTLIWWLPYLVVFISFSMFRVFNSGIYSYQVSILDLVKENPGETLVLLINNVLTGLTQGIVLAWTSTLNIFSGSPFSKYNFLLAGFAFLSAAIAYLSIFQQKNEPGEKGRKTFAGAIWIGVFSAIAGILPFLAGGFQVNLGFPNNRYLIAVAPGAAVFLAAILEYFLRSDQQKKVIGALFVGMAMATQLVTARSFELNWKYQQEFFWQLYWRAPAIEKNTLLITEDLPFSRYSSGTSLTAPLNLIYDPENQSEAISYALILMSQQRDMVKDFQIGNQIEYQLRSFTFSGDTSNILIFEKPSEGCLRVMTSLDTVDEVFSAGYQGYLPDNFDWINPDVITTKAANTTELPAVFWGNENQEQWCYYFEKADLARQQKKWEEVVYLYDEGAKKGFMPLNQFEWLPLFEAYLRIGETDKALAIVQFIPDFDSEKNDAFCKLWATIGLNNAKTIAYDQFLAISKCERTDD